MNNCRSGVNVLSEEKTDRFERQPAEHAPRKALLALNQAPDYDPAMPRFTFQAVPGLVGTTRKMRA